MNSDYEFFAYRAIEGRLVPQPFDVFSYPMGDTTVRYLQDGKMHGGAQVLWVKSPSPDWSLVTAWADLLRDFEKRILVLPYLPSARGDKDTPSPARVNAGMAARTGITDIITLDPHSPVWLDTLSAACGHTIGVHRIDLSPLVYVSLPRFLDVDGVIAPDAGARERAGSVAKAFGVPLLIASKHRDPATGKLSGYVAPRDATADGTYLVVDDICDGGGTFNLLADAMPAGAELHLWVSHGGFTKGVGGLLNRYRNIYTTDSLRSAADAAVGYGAVSVRPLRGDVERLLKEVVR